MRPGTLLKTVHPILVFTDEIKVQLREFPTTCLEVQRKEDDTDEKGVHVDV